MTIPDFPPRTITIIWTEGQPLEIAYTGEWDTWEVEAALEEALRITAYADEDEDIEHD